MNNFFSSQYIFIVFSVVILLILPQFIFADTTISSSSVSITAQVNNGIGVVTTPSSGGGGGGGGGGGPVYTPLSISTTVNISGVSYPLSKVSVLQDGKLVATTISDPSAKFSLSITGLSTDTYTFAIYGEDSQNRKSLSFSFPVYVTSGTTVNIANIFLSPTIDVDKTEVKQGDNLAIFGQSAPQSLVTISVHSNVEKFYKVTSNKAGLYLYNLDTSPLEIGKHQTKSKAVLVDQTTSFSPPIDFLVGSYNQIKTIEENKNQCSSNRRGDLNCDGKVNLVDFSIMAYWYKRANPPKDIDLNGDGKISIVDFSIMAYNWTG